MGSNIGDSRSAMERAVAALSGISERPLRRSSFFESDPWGFDSPNRFTNLGVDVFSALQPLDFLAELRRIEHEISPASHRNPDGTYRDRLLDLDLIFALHLPASTDGTPNPLEFPYVSVNRSTKVQLPITEAPSTIPEEQFPITEPQATIPEEQFPITEPQFIRLSTPDLTLPHPRAHLRDFVLTPLLELHPAFPLSLLIPSNL